MPLILPSMLCADPMNMARDVAALEAAGIEMLHIDVMDGQFVPNIAIGFHVIDALANATNLKLDVHLMVDNPQDFIARLAGKAHAISFHYEAVNFPLKLLRTIREVGALAGIAIGPGTDARLLEPLLPHLDFVLCMTVEPGFAGQKFIDSALQNFDILTNLREKHGYSFIIQVDGNVGANNINTCIDHGAEWLVVGANLFPPDGNINGAVQALHNAMQ